MSTTEPDTATVTGSQEPGNGAKPDTGSEGAKPDTSQLSDPGKQAIDRERQLRREAERQVAQLRDRVTQLEDAGKPEMERLAAQIKRLEENMTKRDGRITELEGELSKRDLNDLRREVATKEGLPLSLASRLQGDSRETLTSDAKSLLKELRDGPVGDLGGGRGGTAAGARRGEEDMNAAIRRAAGRG